MKCELLAEQNFALIRRFADTPKRCICAILYTRNPSTQKPEQR